MQDKNRIVVVGAGIVGVATAVWLQRDGHAVTLIDRLEPGEATSYGNGGVLASCAIVPVTGPGLLRKAPGMLLSPNEPLYLKWRYLPRLLPWLIKYLRHNNEADTRRISAALYPIIGDSLADHQALSAGTPAAEFVVPSDYLYLYRNRGEFENEALTWSIRAEHGFAWEELDRAALQARLADPGNEIGFGISLPGHGRISDPGAYVKALASHFIDQGGKWVQDELREIECRDGAVQAIHTTSGRIECRKLILATGVWSRKLMQPLGLDVPMESERGYHLELWNPSWMPDMPLMLSAGKFVITPMKGRIRLAGILELGGLDTPPSKAPILFLERKFREAFPKVTWERTEEWMGHRPAPSDSIPVIGEVSGAKGVFAGFGHHHVGLTGGPKTGRLLAQLASGHNPNIDLASYSPMRFT